VPLSDPRANVLGVGVSAVNLEEAVGFVHQKLQIDERGYVCVTSVHGVMEAQRHPELRRILNASLLSTPDGVPTVWVGQLQGFSRMGRVRGLDFMLKVCEMSAREGYTQFLYGGKPGVAEQLKSVLTSRFPDLRIVGTYTPPFRALSAQEEQELAENVARVKPDFFWVGLSTPKQEYFMNQFVGRLDARIMVGVGAAFDYLVGLVKDSPEWVRNSGLQWAHRLIQEPRRLWKRYLLNNPKFICAITLQLLGIRKYNLSGSRWRQPQGISNLNV
jgi:N-acetylglucosaminyldiphosphoundecaprenol N-acetyl-beta-D-mannosaminyltransferase